MTAKRYFSLSILALLLFSLSVRAQNETVESHLKRVDGYLAEKKYNDALKQIQRALEIDPKSAEAYLKLGLVYYAIPPSMNNPGEFSAEALKAFEQALRLKPDWPEALNHLGRSYSSLREYDKAIKNFKEALRLRPEYTEAQENLAIADLYAGNFREAVDYLLKVTSARPDYPQPHKLLALAYLVLDEREKAIAEQKILQSLDQQMAVYVQNAIQSPQKPIFGLTAGRLLNFPKPRYPLELRQRRLQGTVTVEVLIDAEGKVTSAQAIEGPSEFYEVAVDAARKARFEPTKLSGTAVAAKGVIKYDFRAP
jgi:TonB family protein